MALDQRTRQILIAQGVITETGLTDKAKYRHCPSGCGLVLLACQWLGFEFWCDPWPITVRGELDAIMAGRRTFTRGAYTDQLRTRYRHDIAAKSPNDYDVHAEHHCGQPHPDVNWARVRPVTSSRKASADDLPPF